MTPDPLASLSSLVGRLLLVGFDGVTLAPITRAALERSERGGVVLFRRNVPSLESTRALTAEIEAAVARSGEPLPPTVAIDQEGGRVTRLAAPFPTLPAMRVLATGGEALVRDAGRVVGRGLVHLGIDLDLAPVLDVDSNPDNPVIGDRSFARDPAVCARLGLAFAEGLAAGGVLACGKHFPGHGDTAKDSHIDLPVLPHDRARLDAIELLPFAAAARAGLDSLMTAHVVCEGLEPGVPATFSRKACTGVLRDELGFRGALLSDDLEMRAVADLHPPAESAVLAITAGCDAVLVCRDEAAAGAAFEALLREAEASPAFRRRVEEASSRMAAMRAASASRRMRGLAEPPPWLDPESVELVDRARRLGDAARATSIDPTERGR